MDEDGWGKGTHIWAHGGLIVTRSCDDFVIFYNSFARNLLHRTGCPLLHRTGGPYYTVRAPYYSVRLTPISRTGVYD